MVVDGIGTTAPKEARDTRSRPRRLEPRSRAAASARCVRGCQRTTAPSPASTPLAVSSTPDAVCVRWLDDGRPFQAMGVAGRRPAPGDAGRDRRG